MSTLNSGADIELALIKEIEAGREPRAAFMAIRKDLAPGIKHDNVEPIAKHLYEMYTGDAFGRQELFEHRDRLLLLAEIAQHITVKLVEIKAKIDNIRAECTDDRESYRLCKQKITEHSDLFDIGNGLLSHGPINRDRVDKMLGFIGEPADLVDRADELWAE